MGIDRAVVDARHQALLDVLQRLAHRGGVAGLLKIRRFLSSRRSVLRTFQRFLSNALCLDPRRTVALDGKDTFQRLAHDGVAGGVVHDIG